MLREIRTQLKTINGRVERGESRLATAEEKLVVAQGERRENRQLINSTMQTLWEADLRKGVILTQAQLRGWAVALAALATFTSGAASLVVKLWG